MYDIIKNYDKIASRLKIKRGKNLWQWVSEATEITTILRRSNKHYKKSLRIKFFGVLLIVLMDDLAENLKNKKLLNAAIKIVKKEFGDFIKNGKIIKYRLITNNERFSNEEAAYLNFIGEVSHKILIQVCQLTNYDFLKNNFYKYWMNVLSCFRFTLHTNNFLKNHNYRKVEKYFKGLKYSYYTEVSGHNMHIILAMIIDIMSLAEINKREVALGINIAKEAQAMGRIGNWLSTWKREIAEKDFSSGMSIYCINHRKINIQDIKRYISRGNETLAKKMERQMEESGAIDYFLRKWEQHRKKIKISAGKVKIFSVDKYLKKADSFLRLHLENETKI